MCVGMTVYMYFKDHKTFPMDSLPALHALSNYLPTPPSVLPPSLTTMKPRTTVFLFPHFTAHMPHYLHLFSPYHGPDLLSWLHQLLQVTSKDLEPDLQERTNVFQHLFLH